jgi:hypothetical protein
MFLNKLKDILADIDFGHICCNLAIADKNLMYVDFKREKTKDFIFIRNLPQKKEMLMENFKKQI